MAEGPLFGIVRPVSAPRRPVSVIMIAFDISSMVQSCVQSMAIPLATRQCAFFYVSTCEYAV